MPSDRSEEVGGVDEDKQFHTLVDRMQAGSVANQYQVYQTLKDTPYHLTYGMHPCVGLSNLPISNEILYTLVTEAELNDVIAKMQKVEGPALDNEENRVSSEGADEVVVMSPPRKRNRAPQEATTTVSAANHAKRLA
jgi:hypothetical protein